MKNNIKPYTHMSVYNLIQLYLNSNIHACVFQLITRKYTICTLLFEYSQKFHIFRFYWEYISIPDILSRYDFTKINFFFNSSLSKFPFNLINFDVANHVIVTEKKKYINKAKRSNYNFNFCHCLQTNKRVYSWWSRSKKIF